MSAVQGPWELHRREPGGPRTTATALVAVRRAAETLSPFLSLCGRGTEAPGLRDQS